MKKFLTLAFLSLITLTIVSACGSSGTHCDAYGNANTVQHSNDLALK